MEDVYVQSICEDVYDDFVLRMYGDVDIALFILTYATNRHSSLCQQGAAPSGLAFLRLIPVEPLYSPDVTGTEIGNDE